MTTIVLNGANYADHNYLVNKEYGKMVVVDNDADIQADSDCFWEPGNYKRTTKRIADAYFLCNELVQLIQER